jgi:hypothetical protein
VERSGTLSVFAPSGSQSWDISVMADAAPAVALEGELSGEPPGQMQLTFTASDDYGVAHGTATFRLDPEAADRRYGLTVDPEPHEALTLDLPMPFRGSRTDFTEVMVEDLSQHPFANLPVTLTLTVTDEAGQIGTVSYDIPRLPGRRFFDPLANAVIELRRDILWSRENADRSADLLRALTARPEAGLDEGFICSCAPRSGGWNRASTAFPRTRATRWPKSSGTPRCSWKKAISTTRWNGSARRRNA